MEVYRSHIDLHLYLCSNNLPLLYLLLVAVEQYPCTPSPTSVACLDLI